MRASMTRDRAARKHVGLDDTSRSPAVPLDDRGSCDRDSGRLPGCAPAKPGIESRDSADAESRLANRNQRPQGSALAEGEGSSREIRLLPNLTGEQGTCGFPHLRPDSVCHDSIMERAHDDPDRRRPPELSPLRAGGPRVGRLLGRRRGGGRRRRALRDRQAPSGCRAARHPAPGHGRFLRARPARHGAPPVVLVSSRDASDYNGLISSSGARGFISKADLSPGPPFARCSRDPPLARRCRRVRAPCSTRARSCWSSTDTAARCWRSSCSSSRRRALHRHGRDRGVAPARATARARRCSPSGFSGRSERSRLGQRVAAVHDRLRPERAAVRRVRARSSSPTRRAACPSATAGSSGRCRASSRSGRSPSSSSTRRRSRRAKTVRRARSSIADEPTLARARVAIAYALLAAAVAAIVFVRLVQRYGGRRRPSGGSSARSTSSRSRRSPRSSRACIVAPFSESAAIVLELVALCSAR